MLLLTLIVDDIFGGLMGAVHLGFDVGGVSPAPMVLGFIAMFGIGGLFGIHGIGAGVGVATLAGVLAGLVVFGSFKVLRQNESSDTFSLEEMVGATGRVSVGIPANRFGTVLLSFAGASHNLTATADVAIPNGHAVKVVGVAGTNLVVAAIPVASNEGAGSDA
jgi:membrane-bound ClpP family serine protease